MIEASHEDRLAALRVALSSLYAELDAEIAALAPVCALSGNCCRFIDYDHTLFLSEVEARILLTDAPPPVRALDDGATCPWQDQQGRCRARDARPLGCRVFFCDPTYLPLAPELTERYLSRLRQLANTHGFPWHYAPLHVHLKRASAARVGPSPCGGEGTSASNTALAPILT